MGKEIAKVAAKTKLAGYAELVKAVRVAVAKGRTRAEKAVERERVLTAWEIGKLIDAHVLLHKERADYAQYVLPKLAKDLATSRTELYYMLEFARAYPIVPHAGQLSWSEYRELLAVNVPEERKTLTEQAEKEHWDRDRLRKEVRAAKGGRHHLTKQNGVRPHNRAGRGHTGLFSPRPGRSRGSWRLTWGSRIIFNSQKL